MKNVLLFTTALAVAFVFTGCSPVNPVISAPESGTGTPQPEDSNIPVTPAPAIEIPAQPQTSPAHPSEAVIIVDAEVLRVQIAESEYDYSYIQSPEYVIQALTTVYGKNPQVGPSPLEDACDYNVMEASWDGLSIKYSAGSQTGFKSFWAESSIPNTADAPTVKSVLGFQAGDSVSSVREAIPDSPSYTVPDTGMVRVLDEISPDSAASPEVGYSSAIGSVLEMDSEKVTAVIAPQWLESPC